MDSLALSIDHDANTEKANSMVENWRCFNEETEAQYRFTPADTKHRLISRITTTLRNCDLEKGHDQHEFQEIKFAAIAMLAISTASETAKDDTSQENARQYTSDLLIACSAIQKAENFQQLAFLVNCEYDFCDTDNISAISAHTQVLTLITELLPKQKPFSNDSAYYRPLKAHGIQVLRNAFNTPLQSLEQISTYCSAEPDTRTVEIFEAIKKSIIESSNQETGTENSPPLPPLQEETKPLALAIRIIAKLPVHEVSTEPINRPNQEAIKPVTTHLSKSNGAWELFGITWGLLVLLGGAYWKNTENKNGRGPGNAIAAAGFGIATKYASQYAHKNAMYGPSHLLNGASALAFIAFPGLLMQESDQFKHMSVVQIYKEILSATFPALKNYKDSFFTR